MALASRPAPWWPSLPLSLPLLERARLGGDPCAYLLPPVGQHLDACCSTSKVVGAPPAVSAVQR
jgi:hypothetical protein